jgi:hypothetical protein
MLAGACAAETSHVREQEKDVGIEVTQRVRTSPESAKKNKWSMERHANPNVGKEETKDLLRGKRPK